MNQREGNQHEHRYCNHAGHVGRSHPNRHGLIGIILARQEIRELRSEMRGEFAAVRSKMRSEFAAVRSEMIALGKDIHGDLLLIHERVAAVEAKNDR